MAPLTLLLLLGMLAAPLSTASAAKAGNPLLADAPFPLFDKIQSSHIEPAVKQLLAEEGASFSLLEQDLKRAGKNVTFARVFKPWTQIRMRLDSVYGLIDHLSGVNDTKPLRAAVYAIAPLRIAFELRMSQSRVLYDSVNRLKADSAKWRQLDPVQQRIVNITLRDLQDTGVSLAPEKRKEFNVIVNKLQKLATNFSNNVLDATKAFKVLIKDKKRIDGLERTTREVAAQNAVQAGYKGATADAGPWLLKLDIPTYQAVMSFARDRELRKTFLNAYRSIASTGKTDNTPLVEQILKLRKQLSGMLGYKTYADYIMRSRMATVDTANALLNQLVDVSRPRAIEEDKAITEFARKATGDPNLKLLWWDTAFWAERRKEKLFNVKQEFIREYLPLDNVINGLFSLAERLYGVKITLVKQQVPVWQKDVRVYQIANMASPNKPIAYFYADLFSRQGTKQTGAWAQPYRDRATYWLTASPAAAAAAAAGAKKVTTEAAAVYSPGLAQKQAAWLAAAPQQVPIAMLVTNQNPPAGGRPSLMSLEDAKTLFHETGHALQALLSTTKQGLVAGMRNIEWDAVEAVSQMQEKFVYDQNTLNGFARHWKTKQPLPDWVFQQIKGMQQYRQGNAFSFQMMLALTDLQLHSTYQPGGKVKPLDVQQQLYAKIMPLPANPYDKQVNSFTHIFAGGYAAGYYGYTWSDIMSADAFKAFKDAGSNTEGAKKLGRRFRDTILSVGGSVAPGKAFKNFRGREPQVDALIAYYALK